MNRAKTFGAVTLVMAIVAAAALASARTFDDEDGLAIAFYRTDTPSHVPIVEVTRTGAAPDRPVAFLVHGFQCNKSMMMPLARRLAADGIDAYALDLPGHGASLERFSPERARDVAREALEAILAARGTTRVALIGHSYGANLLTRIAGGGAGHGTLVMLGPSYEGGLSPATAGNLLVLTAEREHPHIVEFARSMVRDATGGALDAAGSARGDPSSHDARAWQVVPGTDHVSLLFNEDALGRTSRWIAESLGVPRNVDARGPRYDLAFAIAALTVGVALACATAAMWSRRAAGEAKVTGGRAGVGRTTAWLVIALAIAVLVGRHFTLLAPVRLLEGERIASLLATAGILVLVLGGRRVRWPSIDEFARGLPVALVTFALVYLAAVSAADTEIYRLSLVGVARERHGAAIVLTAALLPFFAFAGALLDELWNWRGGGARGAAWVAVGAVALCAMAGAAVHLVDSRLGRFAVPVASLCVFATGAGILLTRTAKNPAVGAIFSSAVAAWVFAVGFVRY